MLQSCIEGFYLSGFREKPSTSLPVVAFAISRGRGSSSGGPRRHSVANDHSMSALDGGATIREVTMKTFFSLQLITAGCGWLLRFLLCR